MKFSHSGSTVIIVMLTTIIIAAGSITLMNSSIYLHDIALQREKHEQCYHATEALLDYGIAWCHQKGKEGRAENFEPFEVTVDNWPPTSSWGYSGKLSGDKTHVIASLIRDKKEVFSLSYNLPQK